MTTGKRAESTKLDLQCPICRSATGQASSLICARRRQLTFLFSCLPIGSRFVLCFFFLGGGVGGGERGDWDVRFCNSSLLFSVYTVSSPGRPVGLCLNECSLKSPKQTKCDVVLTLSIPKPSATKSLEEQRSPLCNC